jgi:putative membrane protein
MRFARRPSPSLWKGAVAGLAGGLAASFAMNQFQAALRVAQRAVGDGGPRSDSASSSEPATVQAASAISDGVFDHELTDAQKERAGPAVHYAFGGSTGAAYGAAAEWLPELTTAAGLPFGTAFWLVADEAAVPALGLSEATTAYPLSVHAEGLAAHLVYGLVAEVVRRGVRRLLR